jgi:hypothetical protein
VGWSPSGLFSLAAVVAVLVVVSLPRLSELAQQENEADARDAARLLAAELDAEDAGLPTLRELLRRPALRGMSDAELLEGGILRRHGYLFELTELSPVLGVLALPAALLAGRGGALRGMPAVRAWPWSPGRTGRVAFLVTAGGGVLVHGEPRTRGEARVHGLALGDLSGWRLAR